MNIHPPPFRHSIEGVEKEVQENLLELTRISENVGQGLAKGDFDLDVLFDLLQEGQHIPQNIVDVNELTSDGVPFFRVKAMRLVGEVQKKYRGSEAKAPS